MCNFPILFTLLNAFRVQLPKYAKFWGRMVQLFVQKFTSFYGYLKIDQVEKKKE